MFSDNFNRTLAAGLGPAWHIDSGAWRDNDKANSDQRAPDQASVIGLSCAECKVEAKVVNFAATLIEKCRFAFHHHPPGSPFGQDA